VPGGRRRRWLASRLVTDPADPPPAEPAAATTDAGRALAALRRDYGAGGLEPADLAPTWHEQLLAWIEVARAEGLVEPNAAVFSTASADGAPSARTVLVKGIDARGLAVYTNLRSRKGAEVAANPQASLVFPWHPLERQVIALGDVEPVSREEAEVYFRSRPRGAQIGAWASRQSSVLGSRRELEERARELERRFDGVDVPLPAFWGGLRLVPRTVEFWRGRADRLHDRLRFRREGGGWVVERLSP
jgi:pyridoxamine 5'-phosphate oxidase